MKVPLFILLLISLSFAGAAQQDTIASANLHRLGVVEIRAFEEKQDIRNIPAAIAHLGPKQLDRYNNTSILQALNTMPGVHMEERSPGSYRLSIRGSSLRSPFGVRNVKIYYNGIPYTDPSGESYLNQLGVYNLQSIDIIRGPGSSVYGAGTGGVMLIGSLPDHWQPGAAIGLTGGSYGMVSALAEGRYGSGDFQNTVRYQHLQAEGFRDHTSMQRDVISWDTRAALSSKNVLTAHFLYSDLYYQTPGALTLKEFAADPKMARPHTATLPGAADAKAAIFEKTVLAGFNNTHQFSTRFQNTTVLYATFSQLRNPTIRNYERSSEPHFGGRTVFDYVVNIGTTRLECNIGAELQQGYAAMRTYTNSWGGPDSLITDDEQEARQLLGFTQLSARLKNLTVAAGLSLNRQAIRFAHFNQPVPISFEADFDDQFMPRFALMYKIIPDVSVYGTISRGFSPPTGDELAPSGSGVNAALQPEQGWNYESGVKGRALNNRLGFDLAAFYFGLQNTIVQRRDSASGDYYTNAGSTEQIGIEAHLDYSLLSTEVHSVGANILASYTWYRFKYKDFKQLENDYSGNKLPSVAPNTLSVGLDISSILGLYVNISYYYSDAIPLNDANTVSADPYHLLGLRLGYRTTLHSRYGLGLFAGADNLADQTYSLGNDINGFGGRYYNVAPGRSFYAGLAFNFSQKQ